MDEQNYKDLAYRAWVLYKQLYGILDTLNQTFWKEFCELDEKEFMRKIDENAMPF